ncbi:RNA polymerase sigma factor [Simiduia curdlanivorans]|uniref:RNA polymerase sigma factor n=1 Tax=Simiduia curdlanivorans TaxID=1492769 RepID=A0ABV8V708_9GAMM|nr:RNA polymerase sigma factor [Simiduia curdlanivorans]MDN3639046.1 RNA polymerase sigma factor [Simiduia curdlanivorans]
MNLTHEQWQSLYRYGLALCGDGNDAFELLHASVERFLRIKRRGIVEPVAYLRTVMRNLQCDRSGKNKQTLEPNQPKPSQLAQAELLQGEQNKAANSELDIISLDESSLENTALLPDDFANIWPALNTEQKDILYLWAWLGFSAQEAADELNIPKGTLLAKIHRLKQTLIADPSAVKNSTVKNSTEENSASSKMKEPNIKKTLKDLVRGKIAEPNLTPAQVDSLNGQFYPPVSNRKPWSNIAIAASLMLALGLALMAYSQWQAWQKEKLFIAIAQEAVDNHIQQRPLEFQAPDLAQLDQQFSELDFTLVNSIQLPSLNRQLLGGRYSSIQGVTAAQLYLQDDSGLLTSLYQAAFTADDFAKLGNINVDEQPVLRYAKGCTITLWEEKGVLMVLVQSPNVEATPIAKPQLPNLLPSQPPSLTP